MEIRLFFILVCLWKMHENSCILYQNNEVKSNATVDDCQDHCETITSYSCLTFDYQYSDNTCYLSTCSRSKAVEFEILSSSVSLDLYECSK